MSTMMVLLKMVQFELMLHRGRMGLRSLSPSTSEIVLLKVVRYLRARPAVTSSATQLAADLEDDTSSIISVDVDKRHPFPEVVSALPTRIIVSLPVHSLMSDLWTRIRTTPTAQRLILLSRR